MKLTHKIESYLFALGGTATIAQMATLFNVSRDAIHTAVGDLIEIYQDRGIHIMRSGDDVTMGTMPAASEFLANLRREELSGPLSRGAMETLSIILYHQGITKPEIDYLRSGDCTFQRRCRKR